MSREMESISTVEALPMGILSVSPPEGSMQEVTAARLQSIGVRTDSPLPPLLNGNVRVLRESL